MYSAGNRYYNRYNANRYNAKKSFQTSRKGDLITKRDYEMRDKEQYPVRESMSKVRVGAIVKWVRD